MEKILIVEDDAAIRFGLEKNLSYEGYDVICAGDGERGLELAFESQPDLIVLDLMLPGVNGFEICRTVRKHDPSVAILILSAKGQEVDKVLGLDVGADDYVTKPFSVGEFLARVKAIFRRMERGVGGEPELISIGAAQVDLKKHTLIRARKTHPLTFYEVELLKLLLERKEEPVSRDEILEKIWGIDASPTNRTVDNFIVKLRRKIEADHKNPRHILTVYGLGYKLVP